MEIREKTTVLFLMAFVLALFLPMATWALEKSLANSLGMEFVLIPAGTFTMGSPPDEPGRNGNEVAHTAIISEPFYLLTTKVTVKQWRLIMGRSFFGRKKGSDNMPVKSYAPNALALCANVTETPSPWARQLGHPTQRLSKKDAAEKARAQCTVGNRVDAPLLTKP